MAISLVEARKPVVARRAVRLLHHWWPIGAFAVGIVTAAAVWRSRFDVTGHAAGHLGSAGVVFPLVLLCALLVFSLQRERRTDPLIGVALAGVLAGAVVVFLGNLRVVDSIGERDWTDADAGVLGPATPGFESAHDLAALGGTAAIAAAVLLTAVLRYRRLVSRKVAAGAALSSVVFPPWIFPGFGIVVLATSLVVARARRLSS